MRVLVCGGRDYNDWVRVFATLNRIDSERPFSLVIHGAYRGADALAKRWAKDSKVPDLPFPADWGGYGNSAGPIRNQRMLDEGRPDLVVAFPGGNGTADMVRRAKAAGIEVIEVTPPAAPDAAQTPPAAQAR